MRVELLKILFLSVLQGITEFLPVSSSGHLVLAAHFLGVEQPGVLLEVVLHAGTLASILIYFRRDLRQLARRWLAMDRDAWRFAGLIAAASVPAVVAYKLVGKRIEAQFGNPLLASAMLCVTGLFLISVHYAPLGRAKVGWGKALLIGISQAFAMLPGISRSGSTISTARFCRVGATDAAYFSFMMAIPVLAGGALIEMLRIVRGDYSGQVNLVHLGVGAAVAAVAGVLAIGILMRMLVKRRFWLFGIYCLLAGVTSGIAILLR